MNTLLQLNDDDDYTTPAPNIALSRSSARYVFFDVFEESFGALLNSLQALRRQLLLSERLVAETLLSNGQMGDELLAFYR